MTQPLPPSSERFRREKMPEADPFLPDYIKNVAKIDWEEFKRTMIARGMEDPAFSSMSRLSQLGPAYKIQMEIAIRDVRDEEAGPNYSKALEVAQSADVARGTPLPSDTSTRIRLAAESIRDSAAIMIASREDRASKEKSSNGNR